MFSSRSKTKKKHVKFNTKKNHTISLVPSKDLQKRKEEEPHAEEYKKKFIDDEKKKIRQRVTLLTRKMFDDDLRHYFGTLHVQIPLWTRDIDYLDELYDELRNYASEQYESNKVTFQDVKRKLKDYIDEVDDLVNLYEEFLDNVPKSNINYNNESVDKLEFYKDLYKKELRDGKNIKNLAFKIIREYVGNNKNGDEFRNELKIANLYDKYIKYEGNVPEIVNSIGDHIDDYENKINIIDNVLREKEQVERLVDDLVRDATDQIMAEQ